MNGRLRTAVSAGAVVFAALGALLASGGASPAGAATATTHTSCRMSGSETFKPGLTEKPQAIVVAVKGTLSACVGGGVTKGSYAGQLKSKAYSCSASTQPPLTGTVTIHWSNGKTSGLSVIDKSAEQNQLYSGKVTSGLFAGDALSGSAHFTHVTGNCVQTPVTAATYAGSVKV